MNEKHPAGDEGEPRPTSPGEQGEKAPDLSNAEDGPSRDRPRDESGEPRRSGAGKPGRTTGPDASDGGGDGGTGSDDGSPDGADGAGGGGRSRRGEAAAPPPRRGGGVLAALALLVALGAAGAVGWLWWMQQQSAAGADATRTDLAGDLAALDSRQESLRQTLDDLSRRLQQQDERDAALAREIEGLAGQLNATESALRRLRSGPEAAPDWRLAEIGHLIRVAQRELQLARNVGVALSALEAADRRAAAVGDGSLARLRQQLSEDIVALRGVSRPDLDGMAMRLGSMAARVDELPLAGRARTSGVAADGGPVEPEGGWARFKAKIGGLFRNIFQVRRAEEEAVPFIAPESEFFLRRNLQLQLQTARLALLSGEPGLYQESLREVRRWTREHFETSDPAVESFLEMASELESRRIRPEYPDISRSLAILEGLRATAESPE